MKSWSAVALSRNALVVFLLTLSVAIAPETSLARAKKKSEPIQIHRIALIGPEDPDQYRLIAVYGSPFGMDAMVQMNEDKRRTEFDDAMRQRGLRLGVELRAAIKKMLVDEGFEVVDVAVPHDTFELADTRAVKAIEADAVLDATINSELAGYANDLFSQSTIGPSLTIKAALLRGGTAKRIMRESFLYASHGLATSLPIEKRFEFKSEEEVLANLDRALEGLRAAIPLVAAELRARMNEEGVTASVVPSR